MSTALTRDTIQQAVGEWADETFPHAELTSIVAHLEREVEELSQAVHIPHPFEEMAEDSVIAEEVADCYLLLLHLAHRLGVDLVEAGAVKHIVNKQRTWGPPDADGVSEHERSEGT